MFGLPGGPEWIVILIVALLIFGKRLPEVGKSMGQTIVQFRKGLADMQNDVGKDLGGVKGELESVNREITSSVKEIETASTTPDPHDATDSARIS